MNIQGWFPLGWTAFGAGWWEFKYCLKILPIRFYYSTGFGTRCFRTLLARSCPGNPGCWECRGSPPPRLVPTNQAGCCVRLLLPWWLWGPVLSISDSVWESGLEERHLQGRELGTGRRAHTYLWSNVLKPSKVLRCSLLSIHSGPCFSPQPHLCLVGGFLCMPCHQRLLVCVSIFTLNPNGHFSGRPSFCHRRGQCSLCRGWLSWAQSICWAVQALHPCVLLSTAQGPPALASQSPWEWGGQGCQIPPFPPQVGIPSAFPAARLPVLWVCLELLDGL